MQGVTGGVFIQETHSRAILISGTEGVDCEERKEEEENNAAAKVQKLAEGGRGA